VSLTSIIGSYLQKASPAVRLVEWDFDQFSAAWTVEAPAGESPIADPLWDCHHRYHFAAVEVGLHRLLGWFSGSWPSVAVGVGACGMGQIVG